MKLVFALGVLFMAWVAVAEEYKDRYWVAGSFNAMAAATSESRRLESVTGLAFEVARFEMPSGDLYRVLVRHNNDSAGQKAKLLEAGIEPWSVEVATRDLELLDQRDTGKIEYLLVIAAFEQEARAEAYAADIGERGLPTAQVLASGEKLYRVAVGPYDWRDTTVETQATAAGITGAWWLTRLGEPATIAVAITPAPAAEPEPQPEPQPEAMPIPSPVRVPEANESWLTFCVTRATPEERKIHCQDEKFVDSAIAEQQVIQGVGGQVYFDFCVNEATPAQREKYCSDAAFSERVVR